MKISQLISIGLFSLGFIFMGISLLLFFRREWKHKQKDNIFNPNNLTTTLNSAKNNNRLIWITLFLIIVIGGFLRFNDLDKKSISHPEIYVPGIELPAEISEPPARTTVASVLYFHFFGEPHPPAYYFFMFIWTKIFGNSLEAIRIPSVIFGLFAVFLIFQISRMLFNDYIGLLSAALLSFNGHHIFWSQNARMYSMTCFLGLFSIFFLIKLLRSSNDKKRFYIGAAYLITGFLGVYTEILFWAFFAGQMLFVFGWRFVSNLSGKSVADYIFRLQTIVIILGALMWAHAVYTGRNSPLESFSATFLEEFISFGFLFERDYFSQPTRQISELYIILLFIFTILFLISAFWGKYKKIAESTNHDFPPEILQISNKSENFESVLIAFSSIITIIGYCLIAKRRNAQILLTIVVPILALLIPFSVTKIQNYFQKYARKIKNYEIFEDGRTLLVCLSFIPFVLIVIISLFNSLLASRLFLLFTPYLLILISVGIFQIAKNSYLAIPLSILVILLHFASVSYYLTYPISPCDYKGLVSQLNQNSKKGDQIFVLNQNWFTTPIFYYLDRDKFNIAVEKFGEITEKQEINRVWILNFEDVPANVEMLNSLNGFHPTITVNARYSNAVLYERE